MLDAWHQMRTTLTLDDGVLAAAKVLAREQRQPIGSVISALARQALATPTTLPTTAQPTQRNGLPLLAIHPG